MWHAYTNSISVLRLVDRLGLAKSYYNASIEVSVHWSVVQLNFGTLVITRLKIHA